MKQKKLFQNRSCSVCTWAWPSSHFIDPKRKKKKHSIWAKIEHQNGKTANCTKSFNSDQTKQFLLRSNVRFHNNRSVFNLSMLTYAYINETRIWWVPSSHVIWRFNQSYLLHHFFKSSGTWNIIHSIKLRYAVLSTLIGWKISRRQFWLAALWVFKPSEILFKGSALQGSARIVNRTRT